jgi:hypothetical protein
MNFFTTNLAERAKKLMTYDPEDEQEEIDEPDEFRDEIKMRKQKFKEAESAKRKEFESVFDQA